LGVGCRAAAQIQYPRPAHILSQEPRAPVFDIEAIFLYPWAVVFRQLKLFGFFEMLLFIVLVLCGFFYIWKKGVLNWSADTEQKQMDKGIIKRAA